MDKAEVFRALLAHLQAERDGVVAIAMAARDETTHGESRPENQYDTRALEASYLAAGQGRRLEALDRLIGWVRQQKPVAHDTIVEGALVELLDEDERARWVMLAPEGGARITVNGVRIELISPASPLGAALGGLEEGDGAEVDGPRDSIEWEIATVR